MPENIGENRVEVDGIARVSQGDAERLSRYRVRAGDIVYSRRGDVERRALIRAEQDGWLCGTGCLRVRFGNDAVDPRFVSYYLGDKRVRRWIVDNAVGATMPNLNTSILERLPFVQPPLEEQRRIAAVLGALDDKIELNRRMAATLIETARAIFGARYLDPARRSDWPTEPLGDHLDVVRGLSYTGAGLADAGVPLHNLNSIYEGGGYKRGGIKRYSGAFKERHVVNAGDVVVANTDLTWNYRVIASPAIIPGRYGETGLFSHHLYRVRPKPRSPLTPRLVFLMLLRGSLRTEVAGYANGTTVNMLPLDALQKPKFRVPPPDVARQVDDLVAPFFERAGQAEDESEILAALRDTLLPKLISGELRIRDA